MSRLIVFAAFLSIVTFRAEAREPGSQQSEAAVVLEQFLAAEQAGEVQWLGNWLETYALSEAQVDRLIRSAQTAESEVRRNLLWHAVRCSRSCAGREHLLRNVVDDSHETTRRRFVESLTNLAPFDLPLLTALYRSDDAGVQDAVLELALKDARSLTEALSPRPEFVAERGLMAISEYRASQALQARTELLIWIAKNTRRESHRLSAIEPALEGLDSARQKQFASEMLAAVSDPQERARVIPQLCRRYALDAYPLLVKSSEPEAVKLGVIEGLHMLGSSYGYTLGSVSHGTETLRYVSQRDPSPQVREAAEELLQRISGLSARHAPSAEP